MAETQDLAFLKDVAPVPGKFLKTPRGRTVTTNPLAGHVEASYKTKQPLALCVRADMAKTVERQLRRACLTKYSLNVQVLTKSPDVATEDDVIALKNLDYRDEYRPERKYVPAIPADGDKPAVDAVPARPADVVPTLAPDADVWVSFLASDKEEDKPADKTDADGEKADSKPAPAATFTAPTADVKAKTPAVRKSVTATR